MDGLITMGGMRTATVTAFIGVINRGPASILRDWKLFIQLPRASELLQLSVVRVTPQTQLHLLLGGLGSAERVVSGADAIYLKTAERIESGDWVHGFIYGLAPQHLTKADLVVGGLKIVVTCRDAFGEVYEGSYTMPIKSPHLGTVTQ